MKVGADPLLVLAACAACSAGGDQPLKVDVPEPLAARPQALLLEQAALQARSPRELIALARAYVARGSLAQAKAARGQANPVTLAEKIAAGEVDVLLGANADFAATMMFYASAMEPPRGGFAAALRVAEGPVAIAAVAEGLVIERDYVEDLEIAELDGALSGAKLDAVIAAARALGEPNRSEKLLFLARVARHHKLPIAHDLALEAGSTRAAVIELVDQGDLAAARRLTPRPAGLSRAEVRAEAAELAALLGKPDADTLHRQAIAFLQEHAAELAERDSSGESASDRAWAALALGAYASRDPGADQLARAHASAYLAWGMCDRGMLAEAQTMALALRGDDRDRAMEEVVKAYLVRGDTSSAATASLSVTDPNGDHPGFDDVLRAIARAGDLPRLATLFRDYRAPLAGVSRDAATGLAAEALAAQGHCDRAAETARTVKLHPAETLAVVARSCPRS